MSPGETTAASPVGAPPSPWLGRFGLVGLGLVHGGVMAGLLQAGMLPKAPGLAPAVLGLSTLAAWLGAWVLLATQARRRLAWQENHAWQRLRSGVAPDAQRRFEGASGWVVEAVSASVPGPGAAWADFRLGTNAEVGWLVASLPGSTGGVPALVSRAAASAQWQALASPGLDEALVKVASAAGTPDGWGAWAARLEASSGALHFAGEGPMLAFTVDRRGRLGYLWGGAPPEGAATEALPGPPGHARLAEGSAMLVMDAGLLHAPGPSGEAYGLGRLERLVRERPGCDAGALTAMIVEALERFHQGAPAPREGVVAACRLVACGP